MAEITGPFSDLAILRIDPASGQTEVVSVVKGAPFGPKLAVGAHDEIYVYGGLRFGKPEIVRIDPENGDQSLVAADQALRFLSALSVVPEHPDLKLRLQRCRTSRWRQIIDYFRAFPLNPRKFGNRGLN